MSKLLDFNSKIDNYQFHELTDDKNEQFWID